jgi:N-acylglucosamine-6-phosphate 2-epimerase
VINPELLKLHRKFIVSCQAEEGTPFNTPEDVAKFALAAKMGGAGGIRSEGIEKTLYIKENIDLPLIGLVKGSYKDGYVRITRTFKEVENLITTGCDIIAIDGTSREFEGYTGHEFIRACKKSYPGICILADISTLNEAEGCIRNGADAVSTCLRGFTPDTVNLVNGKADIDFIRTLVELHPDVPIFAEGLINTPAEAAEISKTGVWAIVVGSAITRPHKITEWYLKAMQW